MRAASEHLALPLLQVWARCKRGLKHSQFQRLLPAQDNISSSTSSFVSGHAQNCWDPSSSAQSSHLNPSGMLAGGKERPFPPGHSSGTFQSWCTAAGAAPHRGAGEARWGCRAGFAGELSTGTVLGSCVSWDCPAEQTFPPGVTPQPVQHQEETKTPGPFKEHINVVN